MQNLIVNFLLNIKIMLLLCSSILLSCHSKLEEDISKKRINPDYNLIFSEYSTKNIRIDYYSISSHEEIVVIDNNYTEIGIIYGLQQNNFIDISNNIDVIEILYSKDSTLLDTYILSMYKSFLHHLPDSMCKVTVCNENRYQAPIKNVTNINKIFSDKEIESNMVFDYNNVISPARIYESDYIVVIVFIQKRKIAPIFLEGDKSIIKLSGYALLKNEDGVRNNFMMQELLQLKNCKEKIIRLK